MNDDEEVARLLRDLLSGIYQDRTIAQMENQIAVVPAMTLGAPDPNTCHPAFKGQDDFVRRHNQDFVKILRIDRLAAYSKDTADIHPSDEPPIRTTILRRTKACGPAPYVGDSRVNEAAYIWDVWVDEWGRYVSGDSRLVWRY